MDKKILLIFSAHPDDHLSCAGTTMWLKSRGFEIAEALFTGGENSVFLSNKNRRINKEELKAVRKTEFEKASKIMGTDRSYFLGLTNDNITRTPEIINKLIQIIRKEKPTIIISQSPVDYHVDHRVIGELVTEATDKAGWGTAKELGERHLTPLSLFMGTLMENVRIDVVVDISPFWEKKMEMMKTYGSQVSGFGFQQEEALAKYTGSRIRVKQGEGFQLMNNYPIKLVRLFEVIKDG